MSTTFQIISEGCVYISSRRELKFAVTMEKAHKLLQGISKVSTFDTLYKGIAEKWLIRDDVVKPFGDERQSLRFVCTFNLDQDILFYSDKSGHIQIPLARLRMPSSDQVQRSEFTPFEIASPLQLDITKFSPPYQKLLTDVQECRFVFSSRILSDFAEQWRHILRSSYAESTFRRLAKAAISIATCNFQVDEVSTRQRISFRSMYVTVLDVPSWEPYEQQMFNVGNTIVVLHQDLQTALKIARDDVNANSTVIISGNETEQHTYLLLSVRHIVVCHLDPTGTFSYTSPETLMDGLTVPSPSAINLLLQALPPCSTQLHTSVHELPMEIQDRILRYASEGPIEIARLGCVLGLGSRFTWMRCVDWPRRGGALELLTSPSHRTEFTPVESKICFGDIFSGLSYR